MPKRKREQPNGALQSQKEKLEGLLENSKKSIFRALKVGRGFERQKLGRRQKTARENHATVETARLNAEVTVLKGLDLDAIAELHLYKTLSKIKSVASAPAFQHYALSKTQSPSQSHDVAFTNVTARLYNSNPVKTAMADALGNVRMVLGVVEPQGDGKKKLGATGYDLSNNTREAVNVLEMSATSALPESHDDSEWEGLSGSDKFKELTVTGDMEDDDLEYAEYAARLGSSASDGDSGEEGRMAIVSNGRDGIGHDATRDLSLSSSSSDSSRPPSPPRQHLKSTKSSAAAPKSTTFLPSLMMGGYWSGSESAEDENDGAADITPRKNRMGQQARRQLWEKKFGHKANHVKQGSRDQGWDARKGAQGGDDRGKRGRGRGGIQVRSRPRINGEGSHGSGANSDPVKVRDEVKKKPADGPLHPSWVAAKKAKEQKKSAAFEGKKTTFE